MGAPAGGKMEVANHVQMAQHGDVAETSFAVFSYWSAVQQQLTRQAGPKDSPVEVKAEGMALLRSPLAVQQHLIRLLFDSGEDVQGTL